MKTLLPSLGLLLAATTTLAQQTGTSEAKTLLGSGTHYGFFAATSAQYARLADKDALGLNGRLGVSFNRTFALGLGGSVLANGHVPDRWADPQGVSPDYLAAAYGGLYLEPMLPANSAVHLTFPVLIGGGAATNDDRPTGPYRSYRSDEFFIVEPGVNVEVNLIKYLALGVGATYRHTAGLHLPGTSDTALNGFSAGFTIKAGLL